MSYQYCYYLYYRNVTCVGIFAAILHWPTTILLFSLCFILNCQGTLFSCKYWICSFVVFLNKIISQQTKQSITFDFLASKQIAETKFLLPKPSNHWNTKHYWGLAYCFEEDLDSDLNRLALGDLRQYTTVPSQCGQFPWTWTWRLLYFYC